MRTMTVLAMGALLATAAACTGGLTYQEPSETYPMVMCSPIDPQCQLMQPLDQPVAINQQLASL